MNTCGRIYRLPSSTSHAQTYDTFETDKTICFSIFNGKKNFLRRQFSDIFFFLFLKQFIFHFCFHSCESVCRVNSFLFSMTITSLPLVTYNVHQQLKLAAEQNQRIKENRKFFHFVCTFVIWVRAVCEEFVGNAQWNQIEMKLYIRFGVHLEEECHSITFWGFSTITLWYVRRPAHIAHRVLSYKCF